MGQKVSGASCRVIPSHVRGKLEAFADARLARLQPTDVEPVVLRLEKVVEVRLLISCLLSHEPFADNAEDEPRRIVRLAIEPRQPAQVNVIGSVAVRRRSEAVGVDGTVGMREVILDELDRPVDNRQMFEERLERLWR